MLYPVAVKLSGKKCLLIGGGLIAESKICTLLESGAELTIISPQLTEALQKVVDRGSVRYINRIYQPGDVNDYFLVVAATNSYEANKQIYAEAVAKGMLVNCVDEPEHCNFYVPAIIQRGDLQFTISTSGKAPFLARALREHFQDMFYPELEEELNAIHLLRKKIIGETEGNPELKKEMFEKMVRPETDKILNKLSIK